MKTAFRGFFAPSSPPGLDPTRPKTPCTTRLRRRFGKISQATAAAPTYLGYSDQMGDPSGLVYMRARWYDPSSAKFLTRDPVYGNPVAPSSLNPFTYADARPMLLNDRTGMCPWCVIGAAISVITYVAVQKYVLHEDITVGG